MKLTKENIYINLQGKSKEELTELYHFLKSIGEKQYRTSLRGFLENYKNYETYNFDRTWTFGWYVNSKNKQEVTIQQLKEILQPMGNKEFDLKGYSVEVDNKEQAKQLQEYAFKQDFKWSDGKTVCLVDKKFFNFNAFNENRIHFDYKHFKDEYVTKEIHFNDIFKTEPTLTEQLEKAEAEVKRLKEAIEEENKPKIGDWVCNKGSEGILKVDEIYINHIDKGYHKITNTQLIELLEQEIK